MKAVILAAGLCSRLRPITNEVPKCMVPVNGIRIIDKQNDPYKINNFYLKIGLAEIFEKMVPWSEDDFDSLITYAIRIRKRYTIFNSIK